MAIIFTLLGVAIGVVSICLYIVTKRIKEELYYG